MRHNLPEARDREADKASALFLIKSVYSLESPISRVVRLGKRLKDKHRLLLVYALRIWMTRLLAQSYLLHQKKQSL